MGDEKKGLFLKTLLLRNFRRYEESFFQFQPNLNTIVGPNAFGKTTILEAIQYLMSGRSFRTHQASDLIRYDQNFFYIEANFIKQGIEQTLKISYDGNERKIIYNSTLCHSSASLLGLLQGVVVTPDSASLVKGSPDLRRHFLDLQLAQVDPLYVHHLTRFTRAMRQRNILLKRKDFSTIESWEHEMAGSSAYVTMQRNQVIIDLERLVNPLHALLTSDTQPLSLEYKSSGGLQKKDLQSLKDHYIQQWSKNRFREKELGFTLTGPHRDDVIIKIGNREASLFASEGQQRSCVMALRLAEWQRLHQVSSEMPLMLVDDVGVSLDKTRKQKLMTFLKELGQVFLTYTDDFASNPI